MSQQLAKTYEPKSIETEALRVWNEKKLFHAEPTDGGKPYSVVIPPPNVTAALHLGHALNNTLQDILVRWHRMLGDNAIWFPGTDHAGIATQTVVEKRVLKEEGKKRTEFPREEFVKKIQAFKDEYEQIILGQLKRMGCSCDWDRTAFTMDEPRAKAVREAFFQLFKAGLIYRGKRLVNWDPATQTALADDEVENEEIDGHFYYLKYPIAESGFGVRGSGFGSDTRPDTRDPKPEYVTVATTRPETMLGDTAVAINPKDPRAAALRGKKVRLPIVNREIPIIEDDYVVLPVSLGGDPNDVKAQMATGFLKVTPAHDPNDYEIGQRHNLPIVNVMAPDATISDKHGWTDVGDAEQFLGLDRYEARKAIVEWFRQNDLLEVVKPYKHTVGHSYRSHVPIEPYLSDQWYCKVTDDRLAGAALRAMAPDQRTANEPRPNEPRLNEPRPSGSGNTSPSPDQSAPEEIAPSRSRLVEIAPLRSRLVDAPVGAPLAYFLTFTAYGQHLHGSEKGSVDRGHNVPGTPHIPPDQERELREQEALKGEPFVFDTFQRRSTVQDAVIEVCRHRGWNLLVLHVRTTHLHAIVQADAAPERVMNDFKAYSTRKLRECGLGGEEARIWTRHGSTRYLNHIDGVEAARRYILDDQGAMLEPNPIDEATQPLPDGRGSYGGSYGALTFYPARYAKTYQTWHENIRDWCISRQLWWGHRIPVWYGRGYTGGRRSRNTADTHLYSIDDFQSRIKQWTEEGRVWESGRSLQGLDPDRESNNYICVRDPADSEVVDLIEAFDFRQDPDVLDTWFSSGLWPLSTMGWPEESQISNLKSTLNTWNPTSVLCTAREIITLWVSRMVMFNEFFRGEIPFHDVFVHAMIQDGEGRKMSKSLGNGVDPLDIIETHGADAMRFTLAHMTTNTQDVRMPVARDEKTGKNTSPKFDLGRNFCNKLWNATRFALTNLEAQATPDASASGQHTPVPPDESKWSMWDRWVLHRLAETIKEVDIAMNEYRFDAYAKACYDFFWRDLCDWYIEAIKPAMKDPNRSAQTGLVLAACIDGALRLMHPMIPFITETLFWKLNDIRKDRSLPGVLELQPNEHLIKARWPKVVNDWTSPAANAIVPKLQELIIAIRNIRNENKVDPKKPVTVSIKSTGDAARSIDMNREVIELLATCKLKAVSNDLQPLDGVAKATAAGCELFVEGVIDEGAEKQRIEKRRDELTKLISTLEGRLSNEGYIARAPAHLVQQTKDQLNAAKEELAKLGL